MFLEVFCKPALSTNLNHIVIFGCTSYTSRKFVQDITICTLSSFDQTFDIFTSLSIYFKLPLGWFFDDNYIIISTCFLKYDGLYDLWDQCTISIPEGDTRLSVIIYKIFHSNRMSYGYFIRSLIVYRKGNCS